MCGASRPHRVAGHLRSLGVKSGDRVNNIRRSVLGSLAMVVVTASFRAAAQRTNRLPRVALVFSSVAVADMSGPDPMSPFARAFVHALRELGLVEGRNIVIERRSAEGRPQRLDALMQELVRLGVDVIVTTGSPAVRAAQRATDRIAIVCVVSNVVDLGVIDSLARPGRNVTGIGDMAIERKELQLLKEAAPTISRVAVIAYRPFPGPRAAWRVDLDAAAGVMRLDILWVGVDAPDDLDPAFDTIVKERADAVQALGTHVNFAYQQRIAAFALKQSLPSAGFAEAGMLLSYGADVSDGLRRAAVYVKKILDGAKPADLPFEQPTKYSLVINMKTAKALDLTIPPSLLLRADEVIQ
jgi:putative ABC transport system substrate-binding protein